MLTDIDGFDKFDEFDRTVDRAGAWTVTLALTGFAALVAVAVLTGAGYEPLGVDGSRGPDSVVLLCGPRGIALFSAERSEGTVE